MDKYVAAEPGFDLDGGLNIQLLLNELLAGLIERLPGIGSKPVQ